MSRTLVLALALIAVVAFVVSPAPAGKFNNAELSIGDAAPAWENLPGTDGKEHNLADLKDAKAVVVIFTCNHCPVAVANEDRMIAFAKEYADKGVKVVAINVNNVEADKMPAMKERAAEKGFNFPYLYDESQDIGRAFGATVTPHVFLLDGERKVAYMGGFDNNAMVAASATEHYLKNAVDAVLAGNKVEKAETRPQGCGIQYEAQ